MSLLGSSVCPTRGGSWTSTATTSAKDYLYLLFFSLPVAAASRWSSEVSNASSSAFSFFVD